MKPDKIMERYKKSEDDDFYSEEEIEVLLEDDEISTAEEAFMRGYLDEEY